MPATYEPIATTTLGSAGLTITFSSITSAYTDLRLQIVWRKESTGLNQPIGLQFNSDTGTNYSTTFLYGDGTAAGSNRATSQVRVFNFTNSNDSSTTIPMLASIDIFSYAGSTNKTALCAISGDKNGSGAVERQVGLWRSTSAINSITITTPSGNFATGTTATLYGILKA